MAAFANSSAYNHGDAAWEGCTRDAEHPYCTIVADPRDLRRISTSCRTVSSRENLTSLDLSCGWSVTSPTALVRYIPCRLLQHTVTIFLPTLPDSSS